MTMKGGHAPRSAGGCFRQAGAGAVVGAVASEAGAVKTPKPVADKLAELMPKSEQMPGHETSGTCAILGTSAAMLLSLGHQAAAAAEPLKLRVADSFPASHWISVHVTRHMMQRVTELTNKQVAFEYYPAELGKAKDLLSLATVRRLSQRERGWSHGRERHPHLSAAPGRPVVST